jgi:hypothetical protein
MNSVTKIHAERNPNPSPTRDEFERVGGIGALKLAPRSDRLLFAAQMRKETGNPEMAKELATLSIREYLLKGRVEEAKYAAKAFGITEDALKSEVCVAVGILNGEKVARPDKNVLATLFFEFGPREDYLEMRSAISADSISKTTSADEQHREIDLQIMWARGPFKISESESENYFLSVATKLAIKGDVWGANHLLDKAGLNARKREVAEKAIATLKEMGEDTKAYDWFHLFAKAGLFKGSSSEEFTVMLSSLLYDSLFSEIRKGEYGNAQRAIIDAAKHGMAYVYLSQIDLLASTFSSVKTSIFYQATK